ncbi:MAG: DUF2339 domain-containing protein, partial [Phycisphaerales bacterium]|nr:DUF2339 domain-containing protein [Phycisphaerales bacterium]
LDLNVPRRAAAISWALCVVYFVWWLGEDWDSQRAARLLEIGATVVPRYLAVALALVLVGHLIAGVLWLAGGMNSRPREFAVWRTLLQAAAGVFWIAVSMTALPAVGATIAILAYAWLCALLDAGRPDVRLAWHSAGALTVAAAKWVAVDLVARRAATPLAAAPPVLLNAEMALGMLIAVSMIGIYLLRRPVWVQSGDSSPRARLVLAVAIVLLMTIGLTAETLRAIDRAAARGVAMTFPTSQTRQLCTTILWCLSAGAFMGVFTLLRSRTAAAAVGVALAGLLTLKFLVMDSLGFRLSEGVAAGRVGANLQLLAGALVMATAGLAMGLAQGGWRVAAGSMVVVLAFWLISMEIDRWAEGQSLSQPWMARQVGWSVWWSIYAIVLVIAGFRIRAAPLRYVGLGLFAITLLKVVVLDLSAASTGLRILSFFGLGVLLLATSILYGKVSPRLLAHGDEASR